MNRIATECAPPKVDPTVDYEEVKARQQSTWASGNYATVGLIIQIVGETLAEAVDLRAGERVLDVAAGNGNATLAAARRFADVTSTDFVPSLLEKGEARARAEGLNIKFEVADAEALPYGDESFDVVLSTFGVMFTPQQNKAAGELVRVVKHGGRIGLANWTPEGFLGDLFRVIGGYVAPVAGLRSPMLWGSEAHMVELFGAHASEIKCERRIYNFRFKSAAHFIDFFRTYYGPIHKVFGGLPPEQQMKLESDLTNLLERHNVAGQSSLIVPAEYLEVVITRR